MFCSFRLQPIFFSKQPFYGNYSTLDFHTNTVMHQSIPPAPSPPSPPDWPPGISIFCLGWQIPGVGTLELSNPPGWGRKKRANAPSSVNTATFFIDRTVKYCHFKHFNARFFVSVNVFLCFFFLFVFFLQT